MSSIYYLPFLLLLIVSCNACKTAGEKENNEEQEVRQPDTGMEYTYGTAYIDSIQVMILESFPVQVRVHINGAVGDGCTQLRDIQQQRVADTFKIDILTQRPKDAICTQQLVMFEENISLDVQGLSKGTYFVKVNDKEEKFTLERDNEIKD